MRRALFNRELGVAARNARRELMWAALGAASSEREPWSAQQCSVLAAAHAERAAQVTASIVPELCRALYGEASFRVDSAARFALPTDLRAWLQEHGARQTELDVAEAVPLRWLSASSEEALYEAWAQMWLTGAVSVVEGSSCVGHLCARCGATSAYDGWWRCEACCQLELCGACYAAAHCDAALRSPHCQGAAYCAEEADFRCAAGHRLCDVHLEQQRILEQEPDGGRAHICLVCLGKFAGEHEPQHTWRQLPENWDAYRCEQCDAHLFSATQESARVWVCREALCAEAAVSLCDACACAEAHEHPLEPLLVERRRAVGPLAKLGCLLDFVPFAHSALWQLGSREPAEAEDLLALLADNLRENAELLTEPSQELTSSDSGEGGGSESSWSAAEIPLLSVTLDDDAEVESLITRLIELAAASGTDSALFLVNCNAASAQFGSVLMAWRLLMPQGPCAVAELCGDFASFLGLLSEWQAQPLHPFFPQWLLAYRYPQLDVFYSLEEEEEE